MKRLLCLLFAVMMVAMTAGCSAGGGAPTRGTVDGNVYKSEYLGLTFTKPTSWYYATDEEIAEMMDMGAEFLKKDLKDALEKSDSVYDMMAADKSNGTNIIIMFENLARSLSTKISMEDYVEALKEQTENVSGMTMEFSDEIETVKLGEQEYSRVTCTTTLSGATMKQVYYLRKVGKYMCGVIVTITAKYTVSDIEAMFG